MKLQFYLIKKIILKMIVIKMIILIIVGVKKKIKI